MVFSATRAHLERVDPGGVIAASIPARSVVGSIVYLGTEIVEPGVIRHTEGNRISLGEPDGTRSERCRAIAEALIKAGLRCPVTARIRHEIWVKMLGNVAFNPISALTRATLAQMARDPGRARRGPQYHDRGGSGGDKLGIEMPISIDQRIAGAEKVGEHKTSMLQDLEAGRPMELEAGGGRGGGTGRATGRRHAAHAHRIRLHQTAGCYKPRAAIERMRANG